MNFRNFMTSVPVIMWLYVSIQTGFDMYTMVMAGVTCLLSSISIYFLPYTEQEFNEIESAFNSLAEFMRTILERD
jgi:hypothetical protein